MKPSGVEWLGDVPEHWRISPVRYLIKRIESGTSVNATDLPASGDQVGVLKTSCVYTEEFRADENKTVVDGEIDRVSCQLRADVLIVSRMNTPDLVGAAGYVHQAPKNIYLPDRLWQIVFSGASAKFMHYWTQTSFYRANIRVVCAGTSSSMQNLGQDQFKAFELATPSLQEQEEIIGFLDAQVAHFYSLTCQANSAIKLLQERRSALISAAVTGQIDVRQFVLREAA